MATYTLDWSETNLGGSAVASYARGAVLDYADKPTGATAALSCTRGLSAGDNNLCVLTVVTTGSSVLTFDYKVSTEPGWDKLHIDVDGVSQANYSGVIAWTSHAGISIPTAGTHTIRFRYNKDPGGVNLDRVWIAKLSITNTTTVNDDASTVDTHNLEDGSIPSFVTTSTWTNSTSEPIGGSRSLRSPVATAGNGSYGLTITKPAGTGYRAVGFDWKVSSESGWDKLFVYPDATAAAVPTHPPAPTEASPGWLDWSGTASGRLAVILPAAASSFLVRYAKDSGGNVGSDAAWIDNLTLPSASGGGTTPVTATRPTTWRTRATVQTVRSTLWDVRATVTRTRATVWRVLTRPAATRTTTWDVRTSVTGQRSTSWNVDGTITSVTATRSASWRTRAAVTTTRSTSWDTRRQVAKTRAATWDTTTSISRTLATTWDVRTQVTTQRSTAWNVDSTMVSITATRSSSWRTLARPVTTRSTVWANRSFVSNARAASWDTLKAVASSRATSWQTGDGPQLSPGSLRALHHRPPTLVAGTKRPDRHWAGAARPPSLTAGRPR